MYVVIRSWANAGELADTMESRKQEITDLISGVPGFISYHAVRTGDALTTVTVCESQEGTKESTRLAGEWVRANLPGSSIGAPQIAEGEPFMHF